MNVQEPLKPADRPMHIRTSVAAMSAVRCTVAVPWKPSEYMNDNPDTMPTVVAHDDRWINSDICASCGVDVAP